MQAALSRIRTWVADSIPIDDNCYSKCAPEWEIVIYLAFCLDVAWGRMNRALGETWTHLWKFDV